MSRIGNPSLVWGLDGVPRSGVFGDVYYNPRNGLAETNMVFLGGNNLPHGWQNRPQFTIAETGFGTGLNFLATWKMFDETAAPDQRLDFISFEQFPLHLDDLKRALAPWENELGAARVARILEIYPMRIPGFHRLWVSDNVTLTLVFDDALRGLMQLDTQIDAWFLDGFAPKKNPDLWQQSVLSEIARLSHHGTTLASFTAAGDVKRGLKALGFVITRHKGFGYKFHRITGVFESDKKRIETTAPKTVHIIGAGLAGAALAHCLKRRGVSPIIFEREKNVAAGASGNQLGLINPKIEAQDNPRTDAGFAAFSFATHVLSQAPECDYQQSGALHVAYDAIKADRLKKLVERSAWLEPHMQWIDATDTHSIAGIALKNDALFYPDAGCLNTKKFVTTLLNDHDVRLNSNVPEYDPNIPTVLCTGWGLNGTDSLPLQPVRGQVTYIHAPHDLKCPLMFGHYIAPTTNGLWALGASFEQNCDTIEIKESDSAKNIAAAEEVLGHKIDANIHHEWANIRTASRDRFPIMGALEHNLYIIGALGSHGIQFSLLMAEILACELTGAPLPVGREVLGVLRRDRFIRNQ